MTATSYIQGSYVMNPAYHKLKKQMGVSTKYTGDYRDAYGRAVSNEEKIQVDKILSDLESDYQAGRIDRGTYDSIKAGLRSTGMAFVKQVIDQKVQDIGAEVIADGIHSWLMGNTTVYMNRGMVAKLISGGNVVIPETPTFLKQVVRKGSYMAPIIGTAIDFGTQIAQGEDAVDAGVKAVAHTAIGSAGMAMGVKIGALVGTTAIPIPFLGTATGAVLGCVIGTAVTMVFDFNYDEIKEVGKNVGDAVADFFGGIGNAIFN